MRDPSLGTLPVRAFGLPRADNLVAATSNERAKRYFVLKRQLMTEEYFSENAKRVWKAAQLEVARSPVSKFATSSEFFIDFLRETDIEFLRERLFECFARVEIVVYLREQSSFLRSYWAQSIKGPSRACWSYSQFLNEIENSPYLWDYSLFLREWADAFGVESIKATVFDKHAFYNGDLISDFCWKINVPSSFSVKVSRRKENATPELDVLEGIRLNNLALRENGLKALSGNIGPEDANDATASETKVIQLASGGNAWINENFLASQKVKLPTF